MMALDVARQLSEHVAVVVERQASGDRRRFAAAGAVDDHHPVGLVIVEETLRERADGKGERDDQQSQPEAAHAEDLAELTAGDDQDVVHGLTSAAPTRWTKTS